MPVPATMTIPVEHGHVAEEPLDFVQRGRAGQCARQK